MTIIEIFVKHFNLMINYWISKKYPINKYLIIILTHEKILFYFNYYKFDQHFKKTINYYITKYLTNKTSITNLFYEILINTSIWQLIVTLQKCLNNKIPIIESQNILLINILLQIYSIKIFLSILIIETLINTSKKQLIIL